MIVAFTGHRPDKLLGLKTLFVDQAIELWIQQNRAVIDRVHCGMAMGVDSLAALNCGRLQIPYTAVVPWIGHPHSKAWDYGVRVNNYLDMLDAAAEIVVVCEGEEYRPWFYQKRNEWMVDHCDLLLAVWDGTDGGTANCVRYARRVGREIRYLNWETGKFDDTGPDHSQ